MKESKNLATLPRFYPFEVAPTIKWSSFTYSAIKEVHTPNGVIFETVDDVEADYWSVFLKGIDGNLVCVADVKDSIQASDLGKVILNSAEQFNFNKNE